MISEERQDQAIAYLFEELPSAQRDAFEGELRRDPELQAFLRDLGESLTRLAQTGPALTPPAGLKARVMAMAREEIDPVPVPKMEIPAPSRRPAPVAWMALTVLFSLVALAAGLDAWNAHTKAASQESQIASLQHDLERLRGDLDAQREQIASLQKEDSLSQVRVVTLSPQTSPLAKANTVVVWNGGEQQGLIKGDHLAAAGTGKDYQLWLIDPSAPSPVSAGLIEVGPDGSFATTFKPTHPVSTVAKFAISLEVSGGSVTPHGPIVFVGG